MLSLDLWCVFSHSQIAATQLSFTVHEEILVSSLNKNVMVSPTAMTPPMKQNAVCYIYVQSDPEKIAQSLMHRQTLTSTPTSDQNTDSGGHGLWLNTPDENLVQTGLTVMWMHCDNFALRLRCYTVCIDRCNSTQFTVHEEILVKRKVKYSLLHKWQMHLLVQLTSCHAG